MDLPLLEVVEVQPCIAGMRWGVRLVGHTGYIALFGIKRMADDIASDMNRVRVPLAETGVVL